MKSRKSLKVNYLARVEGEGGLVIRFKNGTALDAKFNIFEPPRFFEALLRGRKFAEAPDITARICGICPIAYLISASQAMESGCGARLDEPLRALRRLIFCGEWIESHALHIYLLHAPDFLGYPDAVELAKDHPDIVQQGDYDTLMAARRFSKTPLTEKFLVVVYRELGHADGFVLTAYFTNQLSRRRQTLWKL